MYFNGHAPIRSMVLLGRLVESNKIRPELYFNEDVTELRKVAFKINTTMTILETYSVPNNNSNNRGTNRTNRTRTTSTRGVAGLAQSSDRTTTAQQSGCTQ